MSYTVDTFLQKIDPYVIEDMKNTGILASLTAAQGLIESNKGNSGLAVKANNLFGIKGEYKGQSVTMPTTEYYNGVAHKVAAKFRLYPSWAESIADHSALFNKNARYKNLRNCQDYEEACINVKKDGYATSPTYTQTLTKTIIKYKLWLWDYEVLKTYTVDKLKTVRLGADGGGVYLLQKLLKDNGYQINCDSQFGPKTESILKEYQKAHNLGADGICGQNTWKSIKG